MIRTSFLILSIFWSFILISCGLCKSSNQNTHDAAVESSATESTLTGADQLSNYLPLLKGKKVGLMGNQTTIVGADKTHLVDVLLAEGVDLRFGFAPEHGFR